MNIPNFPNVPNHLWDPHNRQIDGYQPAWRPDMGKRWRPGQSKMAYIWPRDKKMKGPPQKSWQRWKDILTGKGPAIFVGDRTQWGPTREVWSNWLDLDNLWYMNPAEDRTEQWNPWKGKKYDFNRRRYTQNWDHPAVWSDVKWGKDPLQRGTNRRDFPMYVRHFDGQEWTARNGYVRYGDVGPNGNDFRYNYASRFWNWAAPEPRGFWEHFE
ncbi:MAG: hypothetical protein LQ340_003740 [Diploschistes diacapsis]|nr:MAG: hypothetical protein LQ340_003740 [Diploschistes diacapsis]